MIGGSSTICSGISSAARRQISVAIRVSASSGRCGPWSSSVPAGIKHTRSSAAARRTSGQVSRS